MNETLTSLETSEKLSLAVDYYNRYPGELVTYYLRFTVPEQTGVTMQIAMPRVMVVESYQFPSGMSAKIPVVVEADQELVILIPLDEHFAVGQSYEIDIRARINTFYMDQYLITESSLMADDAQIIASEAVQVAVFGKGKYLRNLPDIYDGDDFTSRFLMLFESFWKPISQQIDQMENHFDPDLTPDAFIPWLASWVGLPVDASLPLIRMRILLKNAMMFYQYRGTYKALKTYLEIYTDGEVEIIEQRAENFVLGRGSSLGAGIALGTENQPNSILVGLRVSERELSRVQYSEDMYHKKMNEIIRAIVPAHTAIDVNCEFYAQEEQRSQQ
ncbi:MAG: phage tail protein [Chloroflexota bacterium]|nr:phage tail protein [Chloroflexota bacterium]